MCGIGGYVGRCIPHVLDKMIAAVSHRGPDGLGYWHDTEQRVHLGHTRLAVIDHAGGGQPMTSTDGSLTIVYNGEIYNAVELRARLVALGYRFNSSRSDTEVLLHGFREWRSDLPTKLHGMWAFAIYDSTARQIFASRDRFGEKPFYYFQTREGFVFGSELNAVRAHPGCSTTISRASLKKYFAYGFIPSPLTLLTDTYKLQPGHSLTYDCTTHRVAHGCYWQYHIEPDKSPELSDEDALAEELLDLLRRSVRRRLVADVPLGLLLSGGIDSSAISALAVQELGRQRLPSFNIAFRERSFDESQKARAVATEFGLIHNSDLLDAEAARQILPDLQLRLDEPIGDPSLLPTYALAKLARQQVSVALGGDGGDELFAGYDTFRALRAAKTFSAILSRPLHRAIELTLAKLPVGHSNLSLDFKVKRFLRGIKLPSSLWNPVWLAPAGLFELNSLFEEPVDLEEIYSEAIEAWDACPNGNEIDRSLQFFTRLFLPDDILAKTDRATMVHGLEVRSPFLDLDLANFARRLPSTWKLRGTCTKYLLKRSLSKVLPASTLAQRKKGFGLPLGSWLKNGQILAEADIVAPGVNQSFLEQAYAAHRRGIADHRQLLWCSAMLIRWKGTSVK